MRRHWLGFAILSGTFLLAGTSCGSKNGPVPVAGVVTLDGNPLAKATVQFLPEGGQGSAASDYTDADGIFQLTTLNAGDGALPGDYKVTVTVQPIPKEIAEADLSKANPKVALMKAQQKGGGPRKALPSTVPEVYCQVARTPLRAHVPVRGKVALGLSSQQR